MTFPSDNKKTVNAYILPLIKENGKKLAKVIMSMRTRIQDKFCTNWMFELDFYGKIYDLEKLKTIASKFQDDKSLTSEEREAIELFIETPYETDEDSTNEKNTQQENRD